MKKTAFFVLLTVTAALATAFLPQQNPPKKVKFEVTVQQADMIVYALSKLPYEQSAGVINDVVTQVRPQLDSTAAPKPATKPPKN